MVRLLADGFISHMRACGRLQRSDPRKWPEGVEWICRLPAPGCRPFFDAHALAYLCGGDEADRLQIDHLLLTTMADEADGAWLLRRSLIYMALQQVEYTVYFSGKFHFRYRTDGPITLAALMYENGYEP